MSVLYLQFEAPDRNARVQKLGKSGAHIVVAEPRWPQFFELAKKEKPYAIALDMSTAPSHCLETADYIAKAKETREIPLYLLRVPADRLEATKKRLPNAPIVTEPELAHILVDEERKAQERAREKKEAAAVARKNARARKLGLDKPGAAVKGKPSAKPKLVPANAEKKAEKKKSAPPPPKKKTAASSSKKKTASRQPKKK